VLSDQLHTQPERPSSRIARSVPSDLESLVLRALEKDPARRPQSADELREAFLACADAGSWSDRHAREWWAARRDDRARQAAERLAAAQVALKKASPRAATLSVHLDESRFAATGER
jgi:serine/threonine protein kinase